MFRTKGLFLSENFDGQPGSLVFYDVIFVQILSIIFTMERIYSNRFIRNEKISKILADFQVPQIKNINTKDERIIITIRYLGPKESIKIFS